MTRANEPAYPWECAPGLQGLTIREYFAAMAMQGLTAYYGASTFTPAIYAEWAVARADALLAELAKVQP